MKISPSAFATYAVVFVVAQLAARTQEEVPI
jgi:hypothetical protein